MTEHPTQPVTLEAATLALADARLTRPGDVGLLHGSAARVRAGIPLDREARGRIYRLLADYTPTLSSLGIDYAAIPIPDGSGPPAPSQLVRTRKIGRSRVWVDDKGLWLRSPYEARTIVQTRILSARWQKGPKAYLLPATPAAALAIADALGSYGIDADDASTALVRAAHTQKGAQAKRIRTDLPDVPGSKTDAWTHQKQAFWFARELDGAMLDCEMGPQPHRSPVLTPSGWARFGDLVVGDEVIGSDGRPHRVLAVKEFEARELVRVRLNDGAVVECDSQHPWTVRRTQGRPVTVTAAQIEASLSLSRGQRLWLLPELAPVEFDEAALPLDPYVLGVLLADGSFTRCCRDGRPFSYPARFTTSKPGVAAEVDERTPGWRLADYGDDSHYALWPAADVRAVVHELGLCGVGSRDKFIPEGYLFGSVAQRRDLLRGLMLDGGGAGVSPEYCTTSKRLAHDASELIRSLGGTGRVKEYQRIGGPEYRLTLGIPMGPGHRTHARRIVAVERTGIVEPMRCIEVDAEDHLYVTDGWVLTHNTGKSKIIVDLVNDSRAESTLIVCPERVVGVWPKQFGIHSGGEKHIIDPRRENRNGEWVLLPIAKRVELYEHALHECGCGLPHVLISNYAASAHEPFKSWALRQRFDYLVYDESHRIRSYSGVWSKWAEKMHARTERALGGTGTLQPQIPLDVFGQLRAVEPGVFGTVWTPFKKRYGIFGGFEGREFRELNPETEDEFVAKLASVCYRAGEEVLDLPKMLPEVSVVGHLSAKARRAYADLEEDLYAEVAKTLADGTVVVDEVTAPNVLVKLLRCQQMTGGHLQLDSGVLEEIDFAKSDLLADELEDIDPHEPVVVFCKFVPDLDRVRMVAERMGRRYGELSGRRSDALASDATLAEGTQIAAVQIQAGGTGVDFTRSAFGIYYSVGHSLADYLQSRKRLQRPGQTRSVRFRHLVMEGTIDEDVYAALAARQKVTDRIAGKVKALQERGRLR